MQRKPANRLGLRGAHEVREHPWIKFFTWKELYDKTIEAPFVPKVGDNFDSKYCNAIEKIGLDTKEKYENYLKNEVFKDAFNRFTHNQMESEEDEKDYIINKKNVILDTTEKIKEMKFKNPHLNISNEILKSNNISIFSNMDSMSSLNLSSIDRQNLQRESKSNISSIENKYIKMKRQSNLSSSTSSLMRHYKASNNLLNNSASNSINFFHKKNLGS